MSIEDHGNVVGYLRAAAERVPDRPALVLGGARPEAVSFGELWTRVDRISVGLRQNRLTAGERAICMIPMSVDLYAALLGLLKMGAVAVFVDPWVGLRQIAAFSAYAEPGAYLGVPKSHLVRLLDARLRRIRLSVTTGRRMFHLPARLSLSELEAHAGDGALHVGHESDAALITFTTGSSGIPKGANRTHGFLAAQHRALSAAFSYADDDVDMPMFPVFALNNLARGITSVVPDMDFRRVADVDGATLAAQMRAHGVTTCTASPPFFDRLTEHLSVSGCERPALRRLLTGGAPVSDAQLRRWQMVLPETEIVVVYGSTEAEPVAHVEAAERLAIHEDAGSGRRGFCVGRPTTDVESRVIRITDGPVDVAADGWDAWTVGTGEVGELVVAGRHVCTDYYRNPDAVVQNKIKDGDTTWHRMGDTGYFDDAGRFWLVGRTHSTIHRDGVCIHPQVVEELAAAGRPWQVAAVGCRDRGLGQKLVLAIHAEDDSVDPAALKEQLREAGVTVDDIVVMDNPLPVDPRHNAKIDYPALRAKLEQGAF